MSLHSRHGATTALGLAFLCTGFVSPRIAAASIDLVPHFHFVDSQLRFAGSGGDTSMAVAEPLVPRLPVINPLVLEPIAGLVASLITVPLTLWAGEALSTTSNNFLVAALPPLLLFIAVPSLAVGFSEWGVGQIIGADTRLQPAVYVALGVQVLMFGAAFLFHVGLQDPTQAWVFGIVDALVLPLFVTGTMALQEWLRKKPVDPNPFDPDVKVSAHSRDESGAGLTLFARSF